MTCQRYRKAMILSAITAMAALPALAQAAEIEVFTQRPLPASSVRVPGHTVVVHDLSEPQRLQDQLPSFAGTPQEAARQAQQWAERHAQDFAKRLQVAYQGHTKAMEYQITKLPAITFESGRYVVYGTTDLRRALQDYQQFLKTTQ